MGGYRNRILRVDLTNSSFSEEPLDGERGIEDHGNAVEIADSDRAHLLAIGTLVTGAVHPTVPIQHLADLQPLVLVSLTLVGHGLDVQDYLLEPQLVVGRAKSCAAGCKRHGAGGQEQKIPAAIFEENVVQLSA